MRRSDQRRDAVFALYQHQVTGRPLDQLLEGTKPFSRELAEAVVAPLERNIMRVALCEALHSEDVPVEVAIDEAVELAKEYCGADAPGFVNGILGAALEERGAVD